MSEAPTVPEDKALTSFGNGLRDMEYRGFDVMFVVMRGRDGTPYWSVGKLTEKEANIIMSNAESMVNHTRRNK